MTEDARDPEPGEVTRFLVAWRAGDRDALDRLFPIVYDTLKSLASRQLRRGRAGGTLDTTALVHDAYLRLVDQTRVVAHDRNHFFALAARAMRHILVDHARRRGAAKRGGGKPLRELDEGDAAVAARATEVVLVDQALERLESLDPRLGKLVELRFFAGLSVEETAVVLEVSERTVKRDWQKARAFLFRELSGEGDPERESC